ncbi:MULTISPECIES: type II toxin-antitoxin system RelE/ParE family toxin [Rhizobium]|uniref:Stabilisation protein n=1 Tax=Rhizobium johnstonii (strain DSM 114642 / LMG 32736 / 3841) TaxID=216596 RepID=Q1M9Q9_RHIJ3|nr:MULTISPECIES: type II toxin-antitoxin system RelE/ParE family toxin [Rhizobium]CAK11651.1 putative stabilisation protein [Rhizobium johnstonii 3841]
MGEAQPLILRYTPKALAELDEILGYIAERSPQGARNVQARIQAITTLLVQHPYSGQLTSESGLRRIVTPPYPYLIFYEVTAEDVVIIGVRHAAREPDQPRG